MEDRMMWSDRIKTTWNDGPPLEALLDDPWAADAAANRTICNGGGGGGGGGQQQSFTQQQQEQRGRSESQPNSFVQGPLRGLTGTIYDLFTTMPGGNPVPDASLNTQGFWQGARDYAGTGMGGGTVNAARDNFVNSTLRGDFLNLDKNPYFQGALGASLRAPTENFLQNLLPGAKSTFASAGRPGSGAENGIVQQMITNFGRTTNEAAAKMGNDAYQFERGQQGSVASMLPSFQGMDLARLGLLGQAGQAEDAYRLQKTMGPMDFATRAGMSILGLYPGGVTDSNGWSTGSGQTVGMTSGGGGGSALSPIMAAAGLGMQALPMLMSSDRRDKTDIRELGVDPRTGLKTYAYRYKGDPKNTPKVVGPMAQDIAKVRPDLVRKIGGHRVVAMRPSMPQGGLM
jgi:hypothetical protein